MTSVEVYDPAMCCPTGVCGPSVDPAVARFAADVDWLGGTGVEVRRFGLASEPGSFTENPRVSALLRDEGGAALPAVLVGGEVRCSGRYPTRLELAEWTGVEAGGATVPIAEGGQAGSGCCAAGQC